LTIKYKALKTTLLSTTVIGKKKQLKTLSIVSKLNQMFVEK